MIGNKKCGVSGLAWLLVAIGGLNWGLVGIGYFLTKDWNVINAILSQWPVVENIVYILVGIGAVVSLFGCRCKSCKVST
ncbi:MAG: DUF378 domain-containing protein [Patescibacteria group bacterium]